MKTLPRAKPPGIERSSLFVSQGPNIIQPTKAKRKIISLNETALLSIQNSSKTNVQANELLSTYINTRDSLIKKISTLESEIIRNHDRIANSRHQLALFEIPDEEENTEEISSEKQTKLSRNTTTPNSQRDLSFILKPFVSNSDIKTNSPETERFMSNSTSTSEIISYSTSPFSEFLNQLDNSNFEDLPFIKESISQLNKLSICIEGYQQMQSFLDSDGFIENFENLTLKLFNLSKDELKTFVLDQKTTEFTCLTNEYYLQMPLFGSRISIINSILRNQIPERVSNPQRHSDFSSDVDGIVNPKNSPFYAFPISQFAVVLIFKNLDQFTKEDEMISLFYSKLFSPLFEIYLNNSLLRHQIENRRMIYSFQTGLLNKTTFDSLLPYLYISLNSSINANDANLYIVGNEETFYTLELKENKVIKKLYRREGIPEWIVNNKTRYESIRLSSDTCQFYGGKIDNWALDKNYLGLPIISEKIVIAVLSVSDKIHYNKFNKWDIEILESFADVLSLVIPTCIKNDDSIRGVEKESLVTSLIFPNLISNFSVSLFEDKSFTETLLKLIQSSLNVEWLSIYSTIDPKLEITRLITLHDDTIVDSTFLDISFVRTLFIKKKSRNVQNASKSEHFKTVDDIKANQFICAFNFENKEKIGIFAINSTEHDGPFPDSYIGLLEVLCSFVVYGIRMNKQVHDISDCKNSTMMISNAFNVCKSLLTDEKPFEKLLLIVKDLLSMSEYLILHYNSLNNIYEVFLRSDENVELKSISIDDQLASTFQKMTKLLFINDFVNSDFHTSNIMNLFSCPFKQLLIVPLSETDVCIFGGENAVSNYSLLFQYFISLSKILYSIFLRKLELQSNCYKEMNLVNFFGSTFTHHKLASFDFDSKTLTNAEKDEAVLKMFSNLNLFKALGTNVQQMEQFLYKVRNCYHNDLPYHNYDHAVDTVQMMYILIICVNSLTIRDDEIDESDDDRLHNSDNEDDSKQNEEEENLVFFDDYQVAALMLSSLLHDVGHDGFDSEFLKLTRSPLIYAYGETSILEHHHLSIAIRLLQDYLIFDRSEINSNDDFWSLLTDLVISTDCSQFQNFLLEFNKTARPFDKEDQDHINQLAKLIIQIANFGACFKSFDILKRQVEAIITEKNRQNEELRERGLEQIVIKPMKQFELSFIDAFVKPLVDCLIEIVPNSRFLSDKLCQNRQSIEEM